MCFNLNLLEYKPWNILYFELYAKVLISTYWNVNNSVKYGQYLDTVVLISTYWNVNACTVTPSQAKDCFNLNLLECKFPKSVARVEQCGVLISTYWNVNQVREQVR